MLYYYKHVIFSRRLVWICTFLCTYITTNFDPGMMGWSEIGLSDESGEGDVIKSKYSESIMYSTSTQNHNDNTVHYT